MIKSIKSFFNSMKKNMLKAKFDERIETFLRCRKSSDFKRFDSELKSLPMNEQINIILGAEKFLILEYKHLTYPAEGSSYKTSPENKIPHIKFCENIKETIASNTYDNLGINTPQEKVDLIKKQFKAIEKYAYDRYMEIDPIVHKMTEKDHLETMPYLDELNTTFHQAILEEAREIVKNNQLSASVNPLTP